MHLFVLFFCCLPWFSLQCFLFMHICMHLDTLPSAALKKSNWCHFFFLAQGKCNTMQCTDANGIQREPLLCGCHALRMHSQTHPRTSGVNEPSNPFRCSAVYMNNLDKKSWFIIVPLLLLYCPATRVWSREGSWAALLNCNKKVRATTWLCCLVGLNKALDWLEKNTHLFAGGTTSRYSMYYFVSLSVCMGSVLNLLHTHTRGLNSIHLAWMRQVQCTASLYKSMTVWLLPWL